MEGARLPMKVLLFIGSALGIALLIAGLAGAGLLWTSYLWYQSLGAAAVLTTRVLSQGITWLIATTVATAALYASMSLAGRTIKRGRRFNRTALATAAVLGGLASWHLASNWMTFRLAVAQAPFGVTDPQFGRDVGFFVFTLPALELVSTWLNGVVVLSVILVSAIVLAPELTGMERVVEDKWHRVRTLLTGLFGLIVLLSAFGRWIGIWRLEYSWRPQLVGASYADVHALIPGSWAILVMSLIAAAVLLLTARSRRWGPQVAVLGLWAVVAVVAGSFWPSIVQKYVVAPNEAKLEAPYIQRNIDMTRAAFDLTSTKGDRFQAVESLDASASQAVAASLQAARVWTPSSVSQAYVQLQTIRPYYRLSSIETDRYTVNGTAQQVLVAARQMDPSSLPKYARTWVNKHLVYTHGYGLAISSASQTTPRGFPRFLVGDVPPKVASDIATGSPELVTKEPRIYYGPDVSDYAIVNTSIDEFDYPASQKNATYRNTSKQGVAAGSGLLRLAWALKLNSDQVLFSDYISPDSRVLINRDIVGRAKRLAPWLDYSEAPYPALVDGRVVWILDGFTSSDHYPYSQPLDDGTNYLRDSVKVTVDAFSGETLLYAVGDDQIRDAWSKIFPGLIRPESEVPASLAAHFRYPKTLLAAQARIYRTYHMTDPGVFYNKEDQWQISNQPGGKPSEPEYLSLSLPGSDKPGLYLMQPYTPLGRDNLVGWMAAGCDPGDYGQQTVYLLPKDRVVLGPQQISARINQDPVVSPQLSLWNQRGSKVVFGEMAIMPVEGAVTYIQPVFLSAEKTAITELAGVVVVSGDRVELGRTLSAALAKAFGTAVQGSSWDSRIDALLAEAQAAKSRGDDAGYQAALAQLRSALSGASSGETTATN